MKKIYLLSVFLFLVSFTNAQQTVKETYTGTVLSYGSGLRGSSTRTFTLNINNQTPDDKAQNFLSILQEKGQDNLLESIKNEDVGNFSVGGNLSRTLNVVREDMIDGKKRIIVVFERWTQFAEVRGGYRSLDYPFGYIELYVDEKTGKGEGTYIAAAKIRWVRDKKTDQYQIEIENFATFPARLLGVQQRNKRAM
jgi:hypothetical protein